MQGLILEALCALLRDDVTDPALTEVRITAAVLSVDYRHARVHFALRGVADGVEKGRVGVDALSAAPRLSSGRAWPRPST